MSSIKATGEPLAPQQRPSVILNPDIYFNVIPFADFDALLALRATCKEGRNLIDGRMFKYVALGMRTNGQLPELRSPYKPFRRLPLILGELRPNPAAPGRFYTVNRLDRRLRHVRCVDSYGLSRHSCVSASGSGVGYYHFPNAVVREVFRQTQCVGVSTVVRHDFARGVATEDDFPEPGTSSEATRHVRWITVDASKALRDAMPISWLFHHTDRVQEAVLILEFYNEPRATHLLFRSRNLGILTYILSAIPDMLLTGKRVQLVGLERALPCLLGLEDATPTLVLERVVEDIRDTFSTWRPPVRHCGGRVRAELRADPELALANLSFTDFDEWRRTGHWRETIPHPIASTFKHPPYGDTELLVPFLPYLVGSCPEPDRWLGRLSEHGPQTYHRGAIDEQSQAHWRLSSESETDSET